MERPSNVLIFDLDNTLLHSDRAYEIALHQIGLSQDHPEYMHARAFVKAQLSGQTNAHNRLLYFKKLLADRGAFSASNLLAMMDLYESALELECKAQVVSLGRLALLTRLKSKFRLGIITNENTRTQMIKMRALDPEGKLFDMVLTSEEAGVEKPDPKIFKMMLSHFGVRTSQCIFCGDSWVNDIEPALGLGMRAVFTQEFEISPGDFPRDSELLRHVSRLDELLELDFCT